DLDRAALSYRWIHPDPQMDALQGAVMGIVETASSREWASERTFVAIQEAAWTTSGTVGGAADPPPFTLPLVPGEPVPRLTEAWFC
ncbi:MAG: CUAEP/CCAEP-tail radical SAM protein, partial [bacterium]